MTTDPLDVLFGLALVGLLLTAGTGPLVALLALGVGALVLRGARW